MKRGSEGGGASSRRTRAASKRAAHHAHDANDATARLRARLDCVVCATTMLPPIMQCKEGHLICGMCVSKGIARCPTCRASGTYGRNRALEETAHDSGILVECPHDGCTLSLPYADMTAHALTCERRPFACPFVGCDHTLPSVTSTAFVEHLRNTHNGKVFSIDADGSVTIYFARTGGSGAFRPIVVKARNNKHFVLFGYRDALGFSFTLHGVGVKGASVEYEVAGNDASQRMTSRVDDIFETRDINGNVPFYVTKRLSDHIDTTGLPLQVRVW